MIATAIITAPRPRPTLKASLESYRAAGFTDRVLLCVDGPWNSAVANSVVVINKPALGNFRNWVGALRLLLETNDEYLMVCEDDITWAPNALSFLRNDLLLYKNQFGLDCGGISLYTPNKVLNFLRKNKTLNYAANEYHGAGMGKSTWGAQCLLFTRKQAEDLLQSGTFKGFLENTKNTKNVDRFIGLALEAVGKHLAYRIPCLVNHALGDNNSSLGYGDRPQLRTDCFMRG